MTRRASLSYRSSLMRSLSVCAALATLSTMVGCMSLITLPGLPGRSKPEEKKTLKELADDDTPDLISKFTHPFGLDYVKVEALSMVTGLSGTGEDPPPTPQRAAMMAEMNRMRVENPEKVLASPDTALVLIRGMLRPGIQEGDRFDVEVRVPSKSETTSLRGGWLLSARLTELAVLGGQIRQGHVLGVAEGAILVDPSANEEDGTYATRGRILGGGVAAKSRPMGLVIDDRYKSVHLAAQIGKSVNDRFYMRIDGHKRGVANAKNDELIEIAVHPRYKDNVGRYMRVLQSLAVIETGREQQERVELLREQIANPLTAASAALQLEAIGDDQAKEILLQAILSSDTEVRFYAAESLAYLDETAAVEVLAQVARDEPAFRVNAMAALSAMDDLAAFDALHGLLSVDSAETRYGAFRSLWAMNPHDPLVAGENMNGNFTLHQLNVEGPPMIHVTNSHRPEIVLFGKQPSLKLPLLVDAGTGVLINGMQGQELVVSRFRTGSEADRRVIQPEVDELIRAIVELGGNYPDVVQALQEANKQGALKSRMRVDALPQSGRKYSRPEDVKEGETQEEESTFDLATPLPDLFGRKSR
ncbi:flagellar basal body P-ring protein FlgI [Aeoliella sp. ICT_H6.2]|uniref:Flagellar basal body P-ring protein FlgI n=1 Tax=Aeoliella straminimaris TaxID=2954799 RepID=A0A9X2FBL3_9BACT|nr:flagellar basal body P-ring protein FlgI [Aeoliella straminimaris]MCO6043071.1 flagellar basal body P-ring protein FlgI [Aeoliella straminimaris]